MTHRVACIQMGALGTWEENVNHAVALSEKTDADLIVLPELFAHCRNFKVGEPIPGRTTDIFAQLAREKGSHILMGSILEVDDHDQKFNTSVLIDRRGRILARYRKIHLFSYHSEEKRSLVAGKDVVTTPTELGVIGFRSVMICAFLSFIELWLRKGRRLSSVQQRGPIRALITGLRLIGRVRSKRNATSLAAIKLAHRRRQPLWPVAALSLIHISEPTRRTPISY